MIWSYHKNARRRKNTDSIQLEADKEAEAWMNAYNLERYHYAIHPTYGYQHDIVDKANHRKV